MQNSIYKIKYLLFLSWDWEAWFHCLGVPNNLIRPWVQVVINVIQDGNL